MLFHGSFSLFPCPGSGWIEFVFFIRPVCSCVFPFLSYHCCPAARYTRDPHRTPLFLSKPSPKNRSSAVPERCSYCRGPVQCELQILPSMLPFLRPPTAAGEREECSAAAHAPSLLEFGTALVYTCSASCWREGDTFKAERMLVQAEGGAV